MTVRPARPAAPRAERWPWIWGAIVVVLLVALAASFIAYLHGSAALQCINDAVGTRSVVGQPDATLNRVLDRPARTLVTDSDANRAVYRELVALQHAGAPAPVAARLEFFQVVQHSLSVLDANQAFRADHPLGQC